MTSEQLQRHLPVLEDERITSRLAQLKQSYYARKNRAKADRLPYTQGVFARATGEKYGDPVTPEDLKRDFAHLKFLVQKFVDKVPTDNRTMEELDEKVPSVWAEMRRMTRNTPGYWRIEPSPLRKWLLEALVWRRLHRLMFDRTLSEYFAFGHGKAMLTELWVASLAAGEVFEEAMYELCEQRARLATFLKEMYEKESPTRMARAFDQVFSNGILDFFRERYQDYVRDEDEYFYEERAERERELQDLGVQIIAHASDLNSRMLRSSGNWALTYTDPRYEERMHGYDFKPDKMHLRDLEDEYVVRENPTGDLGELQRKEEGTDVRLAITPGLWDFTEWAIIDPPYTVPHVRSEVSIMFLPSVVTRPSLFRPSNLWKSWDQGARSLHPYVVQFTSGHRFSIGASQKRGRATRSPAQFSRHPTQLFTSHAPERVARSLTQWHPPTDQDMWEQPVLIMGAGHIGRRVALVWASALRPVTVYDISRDALRASTEYITDNLAKYCLSHNTHPGPVHFTTDLREATIAGKRDGLKLDFSAAHNTESSSKVKKKGPWMMIECLPENLSLKISALTEIERLLPENCIIASNSSSLMTSEMAPHLQHPGRLLNTHYYIPPRNVMVEVMSCSQTYEGIFPFLTREMKNMGLSPMVVPPGVQSPGFMFNRIWAACKRETLAVLQEGVGQPAEIDALFRDFFHAEKGPCERMDEVGLDIVANVEEHYIEQRPEIAKSGKKPLEWLKKTYVDRGDLGEKSGDGLYTWEEREALKAKHKLEKYPEVEEALGA
ncbi:hypothetical protein QBC32DRAFT_257769 [Pseudoneurospora amorphoporcata]|uniref:3-hydroxyacyl-CoA dehydrogenase n=1 Tax=Pseudoneurospora amorphoporcata TaxID=241081 RepID=A0AAN6SGG7_9PEZI|nr:hypothetical protein QBC32DRAFT_257769 [Pseudoneurospora amorphoporcata]